MEIFVTREREREKENVVRMTTLTGRLLAIPWHWSFNV